MPLRVTVVVPTLDEEEALGAALDSARSADELVVSDGGSADRTVEVARARGATVVEGPPGRGAQLNRGARASCAEILLFLHADSVLPPDAVASVRSAVERGHPGGGFLLAFDADGFVYRFGERCIAARTRLSGIPLGDQAQFVRRDVFEDLGGYPEWPLFEDLDFGRRLGRLGRPAIVPLRVTTSARRFEAAGPARTVARNWLIWTLFQLGVSPHRLARFYR